LNLTEVIGVLNTKAKVTSSDLAVMFLVQTTPKQEQITKKINQQADKENNAAMKQNLKTQLGWSRSAGIRPKNARVELRNHLISEKIAELAESLPELKKV
jgi:hypothetical protein